jgi:hypothetical protein
MAPVSSRSLQSKWLSLNRGPCKGQLSPYPAYRTRRSQSGTVSQFSGIDNAVRREYYLFYVCATLLIDINPRVAQRFILQWRRYIKKVVSVNAARF